MTGLASIRSARSSSAWAEIKIRCPGSRLGAAFWRRWQSGAGNEYKPRCAEMPTCHRPGFRFCWASPSWPWRSWCSSCSSSRSHRGRDVSREPRDKPGLQAERTALSWERSAIELPASSAILLFRQTGPLAVGRTLLAAAAVLLAVLVLGLGHRRRRRTSTIRATAGQNIVPDARTEVPLIGWAVAGFATATVVLLLMM
jgi:putative membrane protein